MNWVLVVVLFILAISAGLGYSKGGLRIAYSLVSWVIVLVFVSWATPHVKFYLLENTVVYEKVEAHCEKIVCQSAEEQIDALQSEKEAELAQLSFNIPETVWNRILEKTSDEAGDFLEENGVYKKVAEGLAAFVVEGIAFLITLVFAWLLVYIVSQILGIVAHIPIIKGVNRFLGLFAGAIYGLLLVWLIFYITALGGTGEMGKIIVSYIYESPFLTFLYENNLVLTLILKYF